METDNEKLKEEYKKANEEMEAMENDMQQLLIDLNASTEAVTEKDKTILQAEEQFDEFEVTILDPPLQNSLNISFAG